MFRSCWRPLATPKKWVALFRQKWWKLAAISGLVLVAFTLRVYNLGAPSLWYDELLALDIAQGPVGRIWAQLPRHSAMPLDYYLLAAWVRLGRQEAWVRLPALFWGVLAVPLTYTLSARLFNRKTAFLAALLLAVSPFAVQYSQEARPYALLMMLTLLTWWGLWQGFVTGRSRYWSIGIASLIGAVLTHYFALFLLAPMTLFAAIYIRPRHHLRYFGLTLLLTLLALILTGRFWRIFSVAVGFARAAVRPEILTLPAAAKPNGGTGPPLDAAFMLNQVLRPLSGDAAAIISLYVLLCLAAILLSLVGVSPARPLARERAGLWLAMAWLVLPVLLVYLFLLQRGTFYAPRYILFTLPAYLILVARGLDRLSRMGRGGVIGVSIMLLVIGWMQANQLTAYYQADSYEDWRAVGQLLRHNAGPQDAVIAINAESAINWYYPPASAPPGTFSRQRAVWQAVFAHDRRWFILSSYSAGQDAQVRTWLKKRHAVRIAIDRRVEVYYQKRRTTTPAALAEVSAFWLPENALTYRVMAEQLQNAGLVAASEAFFHRAVQLDAPENR